MSSQRQPTLEQLLEETNGRLAQLAGLSDEDNGLTIGPSGFETKDAGGGPRLLSRYAGPGSSDDVLDALAAGGGIAPVSDRMAGRAPRKGRRFHDGGRGLVGLMTKAMAEGTPSAGGYLVPVEVSDEVVKMIRARSAVMRLGPRVVPVEKELDVTSLSSGAAAYYVAENAAPPVSELTLAQSVLLRPKELAALVPVSNRLLRDASNPSVEDLVREDLAEVIALREDLAFLEGTGGTEPTGIRGTAGLTPAPSLGANGRAPTVDDLKDMVANLRAINAPFANPGWIFHPRTLNTLEKLKDAQGRYLAEAEILTFDATGGGGTLLGFRFTTTTQVPVTLTVGTSTDTSYIVFSSDWREAWVGEEQDLTIALSTEAAYQVGGTWHSAFTQRQTLFLATLTHDFALRRPALFSVMTGVRP